MGGLPRGGPPSKNEGGNAGELGWSTSERQVQRHLDESRTADGVLQSAEIAGRRANVSPGARNARREKWSAKARSVLRWVSEEGIEIDIIAGDVEAWVIEDVEGDNIVLQRPFFVELEILRHAEIEAVLERAAEDIAASRGVGSLIIIADTRDGVARRHSTCARRDRRGDSKRGRVQNGVCSIYTRGPLQPRVGGSGAHSAHRHNRVRDGILSTAPIDAGGAAG